MKFLSSIFKVKPGLGMLILLAGCSQSQSPGNELRTVVFVNKSENINHLWLMDLNSSGFGYHARRLTNDAESENYLSWSSDSKRLVYQRDYNGSGIYLADADGKNQRRLSPTPGFDATPSWSPDGKQIIYTRIAGLITPGLVPKTEIRVMNVDGSGDKIIL